MMYLVPGQLTIDALAIAMKNHDTLELSSDCVQAIQDAHATVNHIIANKITVYGINTGFGALASQTISQEKLIQLQRNIILSHATGTGALLDDDVVALIMILKINCLAQGYSGVSLSLIEFLCALYNNKIYPCIPGRGSVGASGDLGPLAHLSLPIIGEGSVRYDGEIISSIEGLKIANLKPQVLAAKEGLALLNGLQVSTALLLKALFLTEQLFEVALLSGSISVDAACGSVIPFDDRIHVARRQPAQREVAGRYRQLLAGSEIRHSQCARARVQDPYSLRCQPQIMGAVLHQIRFVRETLSAEINAITDNPLVFSKDAAILSGGNFHGEIIAMAADNLALAIAEMGSSAERRIALLIDKTFSGLPAFLVKESGLNSGFMIAHVTAASCASDNKALAHPHSVDSIPTSANQEDHVSMATNGAHRLFAMIDNTATILAIELLAACQGLEFHAPLKTSPLLQTIYQQIRKVIKPYNEDRYFAPDIAWMKAQILNGCVTL